MNVLSHLVLLVFSCMVTSSLAMIPSFGLQTATSIRSELDDKDFKITPALGIRIDTPDFKVRIADLTNFPALAGQDVQSTIVRVTLRSGAAFFRHFHPRGTETLNALRGTFMVSFTFEGLGTPRVVTNTIKAGQSTIFPQGLVHETKCISKTGCTFLSILNSADPGTIPA